MMRTGQPSAGSVLSLPLLLLLSVGTAQAQRGPLDPRGRIHIPIGIPNTLDGLKTFVEAEGNFSPGFGTYGIYFWFCDPETGKLVAPTMDGVEFRRHLPPVGYLNPRTTWHAGRAGVGLRIAQVRRQSPAGEVFVVGVKVWASDTRPGEHRIPLYAALRPLGPAGGPVHSLRVSEEGDALLVDGHPALISNERPVAAGVLPTDTIGEWAMAGAVPTSKTATSPTGDCSGMLRLDLTVPDGNGKTVGFVCPVLAGRRAARHQWDGVSTWAQFDLARPNPPEGGIAQPDPGLDYYRQLNGLELVNESIEFWRSFFGRASVQVPDYRWDEAFTALASHAAMTMNEGAPDVAVVNYNVFNRDGVYMANIFQKIGRFDLAAQAIDYFLGHPFNGRIYPEADNPGQILWIIGEHWKFTRDREWLEHIYPSVRKLVDMIRYYRTTEGPHWVSPTSLEFGDALPVDRRQELQSGRCDGQHPEYTEAFDLAGVRAALCLAQALENARDASDWNELAQVLLDKYDARFGARLPKDYGSYSVLWPCRLYPLDQGKAHEQFRGIGARKPDGWRYFPLATAHQGLLAGNREAGHATLTAHLDHPQMQGWYAFDEGGKSGAGGWKHARTTWNPNVAMPHGWAIAELWLLLRDCLLFEDGDRLVLLAGVRPEWFASDDVTMAITDLPTHFGGCSLEYRHSAGGDATLTLSGSATPPGGFALRLPTSLAATVSIGGRPVTRLDNGDYLFPSSTRQVKIKVERRVE